MKAILGITTMGVLGIHASAFAEELRWETNAGARGTAPLAQMAEKCLEYLVDRCWLSAPDHRAVGGWVESSRIESEACRPLADGREFCAVDCSAVCGGFSEGARLR